MAELWYDLVPPTAGDALTHPETLGTAKEPHDQCPGGGGTWWGLSWPTPGLWELQGDPRTVLLMLQLGKGQARTPMARSTVARRARRQGDNADAVQRDAGSEAMLADRRVGKRAAGGRPGPGSLQAVSEPAPSWDVSAVFAKS